MKTDYFDYYIPLVAQFCQTMQKSDFQGLEHLPQPFLPLFGKNYEQSAFKLLIVGQDTKGWRRTDHFIQGEVENPGSMIASNFEEIENLKFREWGKNTHSFWGFAMALLASIHGMPNWNVLKWGGHEDVLSSFAWANANATELWGSLTKHTSGVPHETWKAATAASEHLNRLSHMLATLRPRVVLLTVKSLNLVRFFEGLEWHEVNSIDPEIRHYRIDSANVDIFHTFHPGYMRNVGGPWSFLTKLRKTLLDSSLAPDFPNFLSMDSSGENTVRHLMKSAPLPNGNNQRKFEVVSWLAVELTKKGAFMSVNRLAEILNELGYVTNAGLQFKGTRGTYRLVRGAYYRNLENAPDTAKKIAEAFRKPDFSYAYS